jgi:insulysin
MEPFKLSETVEVSAEDERAYRSFTLPNDIQVLVVSDPETDKASAAMDIHIGHLCDPEDLPGLAHFLEHMLFLGTEKYPDENSYSTFLSEHGGMSNAFTAMENTNYYFDVNHPHLEGALDRFAQFFISPLFTESATERETKAVDSENAKNLQNDMWRNHQLYKSLSSADHPFHKFGTGNLQTLQEIPKEKSINVREALITFHSERYSANISNLVLLGRESVDELEKLVREKFSEIKNYERTIPTFPGSPFKEDHLRKMVKVVPVKELRLVELVWPMRPIKGFHEEHPNSYISHLIGHEGKGSLLSHLKEKGWANELYAGASVQNSDFTVYGVGVEVTDEGMKHYLDVAAAVFQYIRMLQQHGPQQWIYDECQAVGNMNFRFKAKEQPASYTSSLAGNMHHYPASRSVSGPYLLRKYDPALLKELIDGLTPDKVMMMVLSQSFEGQEGPEWAEEKWYGTKHALSDIPPEELERWRSGPIDPALQLPARNDLIATDFTLVPVAECMPPAGNPFAKSNYYPQPTGALDSTTFAVGDPTKHPVLLRNDNACRAWYKVRFRLWSTMH